MKEGEERLGARGRISAESERSNRPLGRSGPGESHFRRSLRRSMPMNWDKKVITAGWRMRMGMMMSALRRAIMDFSLSPPTAREWLRRRRRFANAPICPGVN